MGRFQSITVHSLVLQLVYNIDLNHIFFKVANSGIRILDLPFEPNVSSITLCVD